MSIIQKLLSAPSYLFPESFRQLSNGKKFVVIMGGAGAFFVTYKVYQDLSHRIRELGEESNHDRRKTEELEGKVRSLTEAIRRLSVKDTTEQDPASTAEQSLEVRYSGAVDKQAFDARLRMIKEALSKERLKELFSDEQERGAFFSAITGLFKGITEKGAGKGGIETAPWPFNLVKNDPPRKKQEAFQKLLGNFERKMVAAQDQIPDTAWNLFGEVMEGLFCDALPTCFSGLENGSPMSSEDLLDALIKPFEKFPKLPDKELDGIVVGALSLAADVKLGMLREGLEFAIGQAAKDLKEMIKQEPSVGKTGAVAECLDAAIDLRTHLLKVFIVLAYENDDTEAGKRFWDGVRNILRNAKSWRTQVPTLVGDLRTYYNGDEGQDSVLRRGRDGLSQWYLTLFNTEEAITPTKMIDFLTQSLAKT